MTEDAPAVAVRSLGKRFGSREALRDVSFSLARGERVGLVGRNGAGKSTLLRLLAGLSEPSAGSVHLFGAPPSADPSFRAQLGFVPERPPLHDEMQVGSFLEHVAALRGLASPRDAAAEVASRCGLEERLGERIERLSHGHRQRVGLAQALVHRPALVLLDEPTAGLDPAQVAGLRGLLGALEGVTLLLSSHRLHELVKVASRALVLEEGRLVADEREVSAEGLARRFEEAASA